MSTTYATKSYTGDGSTVAYSCNFTGGVALDETHLSVTVAGVAKSLTTHYTINAARTTLTFLSAPANGAAIVIKRATPIASVSVFSVDFTAGATLTSADLDLACKHLLYLTQELMDLQ